MHSTENNACKKKTKKKPKKQTESIKLSNEKEANEWIIRNQTIKKKIEINLKQKEKEYRMIN